MDDGPLRFPHRCPGDGCAICRWLEAHEGGEMATLSIYHDTRADGTCRSCGAPIVWAQLLTGARMPFDPPIIVARRQVSLLPDDRVVDFVDMDHTRSHFASCPQARDWRRRR
jgi:hypothetical protein